MKNEKLILLNIRMNSTLKHLRGRHDQRDHAWNRGMGGRSGGYAPGYMNQTEFQALKKNLQAQIEAGEITQEYGEAIWTTAQRLMQEDYDRANPRVGDELSRRESTVETLANRRRNRNAPKKISANDLMLNAQNFKLANANMYAGTTFLSSWNGIGDFDINNMTNEERDILDQTEGDAANPSFSTWSWVSGRKSSAFRALSTIFQQTRPDMFDYASLLTQFEQTLMDPDAPMINFGDNDLYELSAGIQQMLFNPTRFTREMGVTPSGLLEEIHKKIDKFKKRYEKIADFNWNPSEEELQTLRDKSNQGDQTARQQLLLIFTAADRGQEPNFLENHFRNVLNTLDGYKQIVQPSTLFAAYDAISSQKPYDYMDELTYNRSVDWRGFERVLNDINMKRIPVTPQNLKMHLAKSLLYMNNSLELMESTVLEKLWSEITNHPEAGEYLRQDIRESTDPMVRFSWPIYGQNESYGLLNYIDERNKFKNNLRASIEKDMLTTLDIRGLRNIPDEKKELARDKFKNILETYYASLAQYKNMDSDIQDVLNDVTNVFNDSVYVSGSGMGFSYEDLIAMHQQLSSRYDVSEFTTELIENLSLSAENLRVYQLPEAERVIRQEEIARNRLANAERRRVPYLELVAAAREVDDTVWNRMTFQQPDLLTGDDEEDLRSRLNNQPNLSDETREDLETQLNDLSDQRSYAVDSAREEAIYTEDPSDFTNYVQMFIENERRNGESDSRILQNLEYEIQDLQSSHPDLDTSDGAAYADRELGGNLGAGSMADIDWDSFSEIQKEAWGERKPVTITASTPIESDDTVFGSPAYAYGNEIANAFAQDNLMPPDNPDDTPLFNPRSARFGAREIIETKDADPKSVFDFGQDDKKIELRNSLENLGYDSDMIDSIIKNLNDSLIPAPRGTVLSMYIMNSPNIEQTTFSVNFSYGDGTQGINSSGYVSFTFMKNPSLSRSELHVGLMSIPEYSSDIIGTDPDTGNPIFKQNKYKGSAAPLLMRAADQLRRVAYPTRSNKTALTAQAVNISQKVSQQNSGPSTWPVLGGTTPVSVNKKMIGKLLSMGYSREFVESIAGKTVPSSLFFLNSPPNIFIINEKAKDGSTVKVKSTPQTLWNEIYYAGGVAKSFPVTVNVGAPNDAGRLFNPFIPGTRKKEWTNLRRVKATISYLQFLGKQK